MLTFQTVSEKSAKTLGAIFDLPCTISKQEKVSTFDKAERCAPTI